MMILGALSGCDVSIFTPEGSLIATGVCVSYRETPTGVDYRLAAANDDIATVAVGMHVLRVGNTPSVLVTPIGARAWNSL